MVCGSVGRYLNETAGSIFRAEQMESQNTNYIVGGITDCAVNSAISAVLCGECCRYCSLCLAVMKRNVQPHHHIVISVLVMPKKIRRRGSLRNWCLAQIVDVQVGPLLGLAGEGGGIKILDLPSRQM